MSSSAFSTKVVSPRSVLTVQVLGTPKLDTPCRRQQRGREVAHRELFFEQRPGLRWQLIDAVDPDQFAPFAADQRHAMAGRAQRKGPHGHDAHVALALRVGQHQATEGIAFEFERWGVLCSVMRPPPDGPRG